MNFDAASRRLFLFGPPRAMDRAGRLVPMRGRKSIALLAYLGSTSPRAHAREALANLFWPMLGHKEARNNLRVTLARTSQDLGPTDQPWLLANRYTIQANPTASLWCDLLALQQHAGVPDAQEVRPSELHLEWLQGEFLAGFYLEDCPEFDHWLRAMREHGRALVIKLLERRARMEQAAGEYARAESTTRHVLALDPLYEPAHKRLMQLLAQQDLRHSAIVHFEQFRQLLDMELGMVPDAATVSLMSAIQEGRC